MNNEKKEWTTPKVEQIMFYNTESGSHSNIPGETHLGGPMDSFFYKTGS